MSTVIKIMQFSATGVFFVASR